MKRQPQPIIVLLSLIGVVFLTACQPQGQPADDTNLASVADTDGTAATTENKPAEEADNAEVEENAPSDDASNEGATEEGATEIEVTSAPKLNLNEATGDEFQTIPNVGNRMVREFFEYRPYISIQQFRREIGKYVDEAQVAEYEQYVFVPIKVDESDEATLQQIPGVDEPMAAELAAGRPYSSNEAFLEILSAHISADQLAVANGYLVE